MNKDQVKGRGNEIAGKVKKSVGRTTGDAEMSDKGAGQELKGKVQKTFGDVKRKIAKKIDR